MIICKSITYKITVAVDKLTVTRYNVILNKISFINCCGYFVMVVHKLDARKWLLYERFVCFVSRVGLKASRFTRDQFQNILYAFILKNDQIKTFIGSINGCRFVFEIVVIHLHIRVYDFNHPSCKFNMDLSKKMAYVSTQTHFNTNYVVVL